MNQEIFRQKSIDKVTSPEQLNDYIRVSNPGVWLVLAAIIILLVGICVWGVMGKLETRIGTAGSCIEGTITCYVTDEDMARLKDGSILTVDGQDYEIATIGSQAVKVSSVLSEHLAYLGDFSQDQWVYEITAKADLPDGDYRAEIVVESISPMSFIWN